jgi:hypothetical protein
MRINMQAQALLVAGIVVCLLIATLFDSPTSVLLLLLVMVGLLLVTVYSGRRTR